MSAKTWRMLALASVLALAVVGLFLVWAAESGSARAAGLSQAAATELHVCPSGCAYASIQAAVDAAQPGDTIKVAEGLYTGIHARQGITQVVYISKTITIAGGYTPSNWSTPDPGAHPTTLHAQGKGRGLYITGGISATIAGLRITAGDVRGFGTGYWDRAGGGIGVKGATVNLRNNTVYDNSAIAGGGVGLEASEVTLSSNSVYSNTAVDGGGLALSRSTATLRGNLLSRNTASQQGGGLHLNRSHAVLEGDRISDNQAEYGGGLYFWGSSPFLTNVVVTDNSANDPAGIGAGITLFWSSPTLVHTTLARNAGGDGSGVCILGIEQMPSRMTFTNTILVDHALGITVAAGSTATLNATLWQANGSDWGGAGTVVHTEDRGGNPAFAADGYHLTPASAAIDRGVNAGVTADVDGEPRPSGGSPDLGADEVWVRRAHLPVLLRNH